MHINFRFFDTVLFGTFRVRIYPLLLDNTQTEKTSVDRTNADNGIPFANREPRQFKAAPVLCIYVSW